MEWILTWMTRTVKRDKEGGERGLGFLISSGELRADFQAVVDISDGRIRDEAGEKVT